MTAVPHAAGVIDRLIAHQPVFERVMPRQPPCDGKLERDMLASLQVKDLLTLATQHVSVDGGGLVLAEAALLARHVVPADVGVLSKNLAITNRWISQGLLGLGDGTALRPLSPYFWSGPLLKCQAWEAWADTHWWGWSLCMNKELTWAIAAQLAAGASAAVVLSMLEACGVVTAIGVIPTALVGLIMAVGAAALIAFEHGNGVCFNVLWFPPGTVILSPR